MILRNRTIKPKISEWGKPAILSALLLVFLGRPEGIAAHETPGFLEYEPCHTLCSNEVGRVEDNTLRLAQSPRRYAFSLLAAYVSPRGHYEEKGYFPVSKQAQAHVLQMVPRLSYQVNQAWRLHLSIPFEYNYADNLVLPTLYETQTTHSAIEPDGATLALEYKVPRVFFQHFTVRLGGGYRFSMPAGTIDVSKELDQQPDKALEALGFGTDDLFLNGGLLRLAASGRWDIGLGGELRLHTLPRFRTLFATTYAYYIDARRTMGKRWDLYGRASGFSTRIHSMDVTQANRAILTAGTYYRYSDGISLFLGLKGEMPWDKANTNSLQTLGLNWGITAFR
jgi:hypothetical protein